MKVDYGIDAFPVVRNLACIAFASLFLLILSYILHFERGWSRMFFQFTLSFGGAATLMVLYARIGKFRHRDRMLNMNDWRGDEVVLDVGTGRGLLLIGVAKHLTTGKNAQNTLQNANIEGVGDKVEVLEEDARKMGFADGTFDVVLSNLCLHNIPSKEGRDQTCQEIVRVLKGGGVAILSDFRNNRAYTKTLQNAGMEIESSRLCLGDTFPPLTIIKARK